MVVECWEYGVLKKRGLFIQITNVYNGTYGSYLYDGTRFFLIIYNPAILPLMTIMPASDFCVLTVLPQEFSTF